MSHCKSYETLSEALKAYEIIRKPRVTRVASIAEKNGEAWHLEDGELQRKRDRTLLAADNTSIGNMKFGDWDLDSDPRPDMAGAELQRWIVGCDVVSQVREAVVVCTGKHY